MNAKESYFSFLELFLKEFHADIDFCGIITYSKLGTEWSIGPIKYGRRERQILKLYEAIQNNKYNFIKICLVNPNTIHCETYDIFRKYGINYECETKNRKS